MASTNTKNVVDGDILIIKELAKHLRYSKEEVKFLTRLAKKGILAVETMLEEAISRVGKVKRSNIHGEDFVNGNDAKKAIVNFHTHGPNRGYSREAKVGNLKCKKGKLQVMIAEPKTKELFYFVIPPSEFEGKNSIMFQFNRNGGENTNFSGTKSQSWRIWNEYRVYSFKEFATCSVKE